MSKKSSILYQNPQRTIFLIDVPASIELAQVPSSSSSPSSPSSNSQYNDYNTAASTRNCKDYFYLGRQVLSSKPLEKPYPSPPEPKSQAARARLLARTPESEILFHESIGPFVQKGLDEIKRGFEGMKWCRPRRLHSAVDDGGDNSDINTRRPHKNDETGLPPRKKIKKPSNSHDERSLLDLVKYSMQPPLILSPFSINEFSGLSDLHGIQVKNPSNLESAIVRMRETDENNTRETMDYSIPPGSSFVLDTISANQPYRHLEIQPIHGLSPETDKFSIILFDPPWPNRSVRRSSQYQTHGYLEMDSLIAIMQRTILTHLNFNAETKEREKAITGIWTTNNAKSRQAAYTAFERTGLEVYEVWIWIKITENGEFVSPLDGLWRKPYEVLFLGRPKNDNDNGERKKNPEPLKRIIAAVPEEHSRKPNLRELLEILFFHIDGDEAQASPAVATQHYTALEVFARNLTAGWTACGNDVLKFNAKKWWVQP